MLLLRDKKNCVDMHYYKDLPHLNIKSYYLA